jgi:hypothetical protein
VSNHFSVLAILATFLILSCKQPEFISVAVQASFLNKKQLKFLIEIEELPKIRMRLPITVFVPNLSYVS